MFDSEQICSFIEQDVCGDYTLHHFPSPDTSVGLYTMSPPSVHRSVVWRDRITPDQIISIMQFYLNVGWSGQNL